MMRTSRDARVDLASDLAPEPARRFNRPRVWIAGAAVCALALSGGIVATTVLAAPAVASVEQYAPGAVAAVEQGTLSGVRTVGGVLDYVDARDLTGTVGGTLTHLPDPGSQIGQGGELYRVDNTPVFLLHGALPAWRAFAQGMEDGPDVAQLEQALKQLGYFTGEPDEKFTWATAQAIRAWQKATGQEQTGQLDLGRVLFAPTDLRVGEMKATIGAMVGTGVPLYRVSGLDKKITADVKLGDQKLAQLGVTVQVHLPDGTTAPGTIVSVGQVTEREAAGGTTQVIPIAVVLDDPTVVDGLQRVNVTIDLPSETRENVLSVPVDALLALPGGGFGVERVNADGTTEQLPVTVGLFAGGRVEISGDDINAGDDVVVPKR